MYLNSWKNKNNKVEVYELLVPDENVPMWQPKSLRSVGSFDSIFVRLSNGIEIDDIEKHFRDKYETPAKDALSHAIDDCKITIDEWHHLINFVACHIVRSPAFIIRILNSGKKDCIPIFENVCKNLPENFRTTSIDISKVEDNDSYNTLFPIRITKTTNCRGELEISFETVIGKQFYLWIMLYLLENTSKVLHNHKWGIITVDDKVNLPTSDSPVICLNYNNVNDYNFGGGWDRKNSNFLFPISPKKILYTQVGVKVKPRIKVDYKKSLFLKKIIIEHAHRIIISNIQDEEVAKCRRRVISEQEFKREKKMWKDFQENYLVEESKYIK